MSKKVSYKGVELKPWVSSLTWDKNGRCFGWSFDSELYTDDGYGFWLGIEGDIGWKCESFTALDVETFADDSWKDSLVIV